MNQLKKYSPYLIIFILGCVCGRYTLPAKIVEKTVEVVKWKEREDKQEDRNKVTIITETVKPDGTKTTIKKIVDKSQIDTVTDKSGESHKETDKTIEYNKSTVVSLYGGLDIRHPQNGYVYGLGINERVIGPFWLGAILQSDGYLHIGLGLSF